MTWKDISLQKFLKIQDILSVQDEYTGLNLIDCVYDIDSASIPISELKNYKIDFLKEEIPNVDIQKIYVLNDAEYDSNFDLTIVTAAQYIDFTNYMNEEQPKYEDLLSVFFVPKGHKYNDGYDINEVKQDLLDLDICTVKSATFFFKKQLMAFASYFQSSLIQAVQKMKIDKTKKKELLARLEIMDLASLVSYPMS